MTWDVFASGLRPGSSPGGVRRPKGHRNTELAPNPRQYAVRWRNPSVFRVPWAAAARLRRRCANQPRSGVKLPSLQEHRERWIPMPESSPVRSMEAVVPRCSRHALRRPTRASTRWQPRGRLPCGEHSPTAGSRRASRRPGPVAKGKTLVTPIQDTLPQDQAADEEALARELRLTDLDHSWAIAAAASRDSRQGKSEKPQGIRAANPEPGGMRVRRGARAARDRRARLFNENTETAGPRAGETGSMPSLQVEIPSDVRPRRGVVLCHLVQARFVVIAVI